MGIIFSAQNLAGSVINRLTGQLSNTSNMAETLGKRFGVSADVVTASLKRIAGGTVLAIAGMKGLSLAFGEPVTEAANLEDILLSIQAKAGLTGKQVDELTQGFLELSSALPLSAEELAKVGVVAAQLGLADPAQIQALALQASQLFRAVKEFGSEESAAMSLARLNNLMGLNITEANKLSSSLVKLGNTTQANGAQIAEATISFAGAARTFGLGAAEATA